MIKLILMDIDGVITDGKVRISSDGKEIKQIDFKDIDAISEIKRKNYEIGFITGEDTEFAEYLNNKFKPQYFYKACKDKLSAVKAIEKDGDFKSEDICFVGDSKHDLAAIDYVGLGSCPNNASDEVKLISDIVLKKNGGDGCIDELSKIIFGLNSESNEIFDKCYAEHINMLKLIQSDVTLKKNIIKTADCIVDAYLNDKKLILCGNGGSAADAQHIVAEFVSRFYMERKALDAEALTTNTSVLTAIGNDYSFDRIFARQVEAKGKSGDILLGISTSGNSVNVIEAFKTAKELNMKTIVLTGQKVNDNLIKYCDVILNIPSTITPRIQEAHIFIGHMICEYVELKLFGDKNE